MDDIINLIYVPGDLLQSFLRLFVLCLSIDCIFGFGQLIGNFKRSVG